MLQNIYYSLQVILVIAGCLGGAWATVYAFKAGSAKKLAKTDEALSKAQEDLVHVLTEGRDAWKIKFEEKQMEMDKYRDWVHAKNETDNARMLALDKENLELKHRTDMVPVMDTLKQITVVQASIVSGMERVMLSLEKIESRLTK